MTYSLPDLKTSAFSSLKRLRCLFTFVILMEVACSCSTGPKPSPQDVQTFSKTGSQANSNGCLAMVNNYCNQLYSPKASGNMFIERKKPIQILKGETPNQFSQVFYNYSLAKLRNRKRLPGDFLSTLDHYGYFEMLEDFIHRKPIPKMTLEERLASDHLSYVLGGIWESAIDQTVLSRMAAKFKGFQQIPSRLVPIEYEVEERRTRRTLISEFSRVLWRDDSNWKKVTEGFNDLKESYGRLIDHLALPQDIRLDWKHRIDSIELALPGSRPEIADEECSTTTINAYYYRYLNLITVCAGDFNSEDILLTLAHEMGHSLDFERSIYIFEQSSDLAADQKLLRHRLCESTETFSCSDWNQLKQDFPQKLHLLENYSPPLADFHRCLKKNTDLKPLTDDDAQRLANRIAKSRVASLAVSDVYLSLIKDKVPLRNGKMQNNPNFLNPCSYYLWSKKEEPIDDELYTLAYFTAEYKCSSGEESQRLKNAIDVSQKLTAEVIKAALKAEAEFSSRPELVNEGFSSSPTERFADVLGTYAVSEYLSRFPDQWERRTKFLASTSWLCQEPSLATVFPDDSKVEMQFNSDPHTLGADRQMEILSLPTRKSLSCDKDFEFKECSLPFTN